MPSISVVIPAYNEELRIGSAIESLLNQTHPVDEIIVVDNNSIDNTVSIAKKLGVTVISETEQGMISARNAGFNYARSEVIGRIDADTLVHRDWAKKIHEHFANENTVGLAGKVEYHDSRLTRRFNFAKGYSVAMRKMYGHHLLLGPSMAIRASTWRMVKDYVCLDDKKVHEDIDLSLCINEHGYIHYDPSWSAKTSARRIVQNPFSFFIEYPIRNFKTYRHFKLRKKQNNGFK